MQASIATERHYTPAQVAELWALSEDFVRRMFHDQPIKVAVQIEQ